MKNKFLFLFVLLLTGSLAFSQVVKDSINQTDSKGRKQGKWEEKLTPGTTKGVYVNDNKEGVWVSYGANGNLIKIENFTKGLHDGITVEIDQRGYLLSETYYENDLPEGVAKRYYYGSNPASIITYHKGKKNGSYKVYYENSAGKLMEESNYVDDIKDGMSKWYTIKGDLIAEYKYKMNSLEGVQKSYAEGNKLLSEQTYKDNVENGPYIEYYPDGKTKVEGVYVNGKKSGNWKEYAEDGSVQNEGAYVDDLKDGKWTEYDFSGKTVKVTKYVKGELK
jgi:antitoxin component YwqK of YwqJK toxin-antitoxin module